MLFNFFKIKPALLVKPGLVVAAGLSMTLLDISVSRAAGLQSSLMSQVQAATCYPVPQQGSSQPAGGGPPLSINPADWIGWVLGELCKSVATVFFTLTNQVINWGSGCSQAGINFVSQTPNYIRLDASRADNWQLFFWDGRFIGAALLLQCSFVALSIIWNKQIGNGYAGAQEALTRTFLGAALLLISASLLDWSVELCNAINNLFASRLSLFDPNSLQVDANGNIFNTVLAMAAALASLLFVMQMATRYIYLILLQFIFPIGSIFWINRGTHGYARLLFSSFVATLFVQPLQLAVIYITGNLKDGTRDDTSLSMLFGICGLFLALGLPRVMNSVLGGNTPIGGAGIFFISRMAAGGVSGAVRGQLSSNGGGGSTGGRGGNNSGGRPGGGPGFPSGGRGSFSSSNGGRPTGSTPGTRGTGQTGTGASPSQRGTTTTRYGSNPQAGDPGSGFNESLRHGGSGQTAFRNQNSTQTGGGGNSPTGATAPSMSQNTARPAVTGGQLPIQGGVSPIATLNQGGIPPGKGLPVNNLAATAPAANPGNTGPIEGITNPARVSQAQSAMSQAGAGGGAGSGKGGTTWLPGSTAGAANPVYTGESGSTAIYRNRHGRISRNEPPGGGAGANQIPVQNSQTPFANSSTIPAAPAEHHSQPAPTGPRISRTSGYRPGGRRGESRSGLEGDTHHVI